VALATARDDVDELRRLVASGTSANSRTPQGDTLLHVALHAGALRSLETLLTLDADPLAEDRRGRSTLGLSAAQEDGAALKLLLSANVDVNRHAKREDAPLVIAVRAGLTDNARPLLDAGAKANVGDANQRSALSLAATQSDPQLLTLLLQHRVDVLQRDGAGRSALWHAARAGQSAAAQALLGAHADPEAADKEGNTPLIAAALSGNLATVELLLQARVRVDATTSGGDTALLVAAAAGRTDIVQALLRASARSNLQNRHGDTALIAASRIGNVAICRVLLKAGANPALRNKDRATAADLARERGFVAVASEIDGQG
jgi:ankyrin repeat protein